MDTMYMTDTEQTIQSGSMIDLHTHFLPKIDDGSSSVEESLKMLADSKKQGIDICVATPHCHLHKESDLEHFLRRRQAAFEELMSAAPGSGLPAIYLGGEVYLDNNINKYDGIERLCITGTKYILVELPRQRLERRITEWIFNLTVKGLKPILAHVERNDLDELEEMGIWDLDIIFQLNAQSFLGFSERRRVKKILARDKKFVVSSDMHNVTNRPQCMLRARKVSERKFPSLTEEMFGGNGREIFVGAEPIG